MSSPSVTIEVGPMLNEIEALPIGVLGTWREINGIRLQNQVQFGDGREWTQVTEGDLLPRGALRKVEERGFTDPWAKELLEYEAD